MKQDAVLINAAKGGIVNEKGLYSALSQNVIRAEEKMCAQDLYAILDH